MHPCLFASLLVLMQHKWVLLTENHRFMIIGHCNLHKLALLVLCWNILIRQGCCFLFFALGIQCNCHEHFAGRFSLGSRYWWLRWNDSSAHFFHCDDQFGGLQYFGARKTVRPRKLKCQIDTGKKHCLHPRELCSHTNPDIYFWDPLSLLHNLFFIFCNY